ncbi:MAG: hypothetical protein NVS3B3_24290 [Aquirhabdus sp.]
MILRLQFVYLLLAVTYNLTSLVCLNKFGQPLTPTNPLAGLVMLAGFGFALLANVCRFDGAYKWLMLIFALIIGIGGVLTHLIRGYSELYSSRGAWLAAILINVYGVAVCIGGFLNRR